MHVIDTVNMIINLILLLESIQNPLMSIFKDEMSTASVTLVKAIIHKALQPATDMVNPLV